MAAAVAATANTGTSAGDNINNPTSAANSKLPATPPVKPIVLSISA